MPREIEYRCWDKIKKEWVLKDIYFGIDGRILEKEYQGFLEPTDIFEVSQWTGLRDSKGVKVFEGDIVVKNCYLFFDNGKPNYRGVVEWIYSQWQVVLYCINPEKGGISDGINEGLNDEGFEEGANSDWEVIGNIYQNTELLEVQND